MASTTTVLVTTTDDLDGTEGARTVRFGLDDRQYMIDLSPEHEAQLREALALYIGHAKPATASKDAKKRGSRAGSRAVEIRNWARAQGRTIPERGRLPKALVDEFNAAQGQRGTAQPEPIPAALA